MKKILFLIIYTSLAVSVIANRYYVSPNGSNTNNGLSAEAPFETIHFALSNIKPDSGDTLILLPGTYEISKSIYLYPGISLTGIEKQEENTIIQCVGDDFDIAIDMQYDKYPGNAIHDIFINGNQTLSNFTLIGNKMIPTGIISTARHCVKIKNLIIKDFVSGGINLSAYKEYFINGYNSKKIKGCEISHCLLFENGSLSATGDFSYHSNISIGGWLGGSLHHCTIIDTLNDMNGSGMGIMGMERTKIYDNNIMINVYEKNHWGGIFSVVTGYTAGLEFFNNEVNSGISCENRVPYEKMNIPGVPNIMIFNNRFVGTHPNSVGIQAIELYVDYAEIYNNYFENFFHCITSWHGNDTVTHVDIHHNIFRGAGKGYAIHLTMGGQSYNDPANHSVYRHFNIYHNVFDGYRFAIYNPHGKTENFDIKNNVFINLDEGVWQHTSEESCFDIRFDHNLAYLHNKLQNNNSATFTHTITGKEPGFALTGNQPFEYYKALDANAEIVDAGIEIPVYNHGFSGEKPDIGVYEFNGTYPVRLISPSFSIPEGKYSGEIELAIENLNENATVYYTTDGSEPDKGSGKIYTNKLTINKSTLIRAIAIDENNWSSIIMQAYYEICQNRAERVVFYPSANSYDSPQIISFETETPGASIYYSLNGRLPNPSTGYLYEKPLYLDSTVSIRAIAYAEGLYQSLPNNARYEIGFTEPESKTIYNDTSKNFNYSSHLWLHKANRQLGDYNDDVHICYNTGAFVEFKFSGRGIAILAERNNDKTKKAGIYIDGKPITTISLYSPDQHISDTVFVMNGLSENKHVLKMILEGNTGNMAIDACIVYHPVSAKCVNPIADDIKIYRQTANNCILIESKKLNLEKSDIRLFNIEGKICNIQSMYSDSRRIILNTESFHTGIYILQITIHKKQINHKIYIENR